MSGTESGITVNPQSNFWHQASAADFNAGTYSGTALANSTTGGIQLASTTFSDDFNGPSLGSSWTRTAWASGGTVTFSGGVVSLASTSVLSVPAAGSNGVEASVRFGAAPYQHFGLATGLASASGNSWAIFSTNGTSDTLYARVNVNGSTRDVSLGALPTGFHTYKVQPVSGAIQFYVDGTLRTTIRGTLPMGTSVKVALSAYTATVLKADWVRVLGGSSPTSGTFTSSVFDAGRLATWGTASWTANLPAGTTVVVQTRSGNTATPDGTWSGWTTVTNGGQVSSPSGEFLQYRVLLTTSNPTVTPTLISIDFNWS